MNDKEPIKTDKKHNKLFINSIPAKICLKPHNKRANRPPYPHAKHTY